MSRTSRQEIVDSTLSSALACGCDIVQPKLRGLWSRIEIKRGIANTYHPDGSVLTTFDIPNQDIVCTLVGDLFGPPRHEVSQIVVWDCWAVGSNEDTRPAYEDVTMYHYRDRFAFARQQVSLVGLPLVLVKNYPIARAHELWEIDEPMWNGLVFRCSRDPVGVPVRVARKYKEVPRALI